MQVRRLDANHDMLFGQGLLNLATEQEACMQNVRTRLYLLQGEWFLDTSAGVPWTQSIAGVKPADLPLTEALIKQRILSTVDVTALLNFELLYDTTTRRVSITSDVLTVYGPTGVSL